MTGSYHKKLQLLIAQSNMLAVSKNILVMVRGGDQLLVEFQIFVCAGINSTTYRDPNSVPVVKNHGQTMFNGESFVFQQDGFPLQNANINL